MDRINESASVYWPKLVVRVAGGFSAALGLLVLVGWHTHTASLIQVLPSLAPMGYNAALAFLFCGAGLLAAGFRRSLPAMACGGIPAIVGFLTLLEYLFGANLGIDELLMGAYITVGTANPGRMAPNSALCFVIAGSALLLMGRWWFRQRPLILGLLGSIIAGLGMVGFSGYLTGITTTYVWGGLTPMAVHAALGFTVLGAGISVFAWGQDRGEEAGAPPWLPVVFGACALTVTLVLWQALDAEHRMRTERAVRSAAADAKNEITARMESGMLPLVRLASFWEFGGKAGRKGWEVIAKLNLNHYPGYQAIGWVGPSFRDRWILLPGGNGAVPDLDSRFEEPLRRALETVRVPGRVGLTGTVDLSRGGKGFLACLPVFSKEGFAGLVVGVFHVQTLLEDILRRNIAPGYSLAVFEGEEEIYSRYPAGRQQEKEWGWQMNVDLRGLAWRVRASPTPELQAEQQSRLSEAVLAVGVLTAALLACAVHLAQTARRRTKETYQLCRQLEQEITERKSAEEEIGRLNAGLEQRVAERTTQYRDAIKQLEAFSYSISHDLRAPLRAINGFSNALLEDYGPKLEAEARDYLHSIARGASRMGQLIDDLLAFSRLARRDIEPSNIEMNEVARSVWEELRAVVPDRSAECHIQALPPARGDRAMIRQVFANLLSNAIKFTRSRDTALIEVGGSSDGESQNSYYVKDNGAGFDMQYADKLFGLFQRLHTADEFEGTGVGLAIVQRIVHRQGGRVWAEGKVNEGATFHFTLPAG